MDKLKLIISSAYASILTIFLVVVITIWAEMFAPLKDWLADFSGHHWVSKSILSVLVYAVATVVLYATLRKPNPTSAPKIIRNLLVLTAIGVLAITAFYTGHHLGFL
ncbi:MAG: hypothetical protein Q8P99_02390 [bacterium]|nr:hypothetical protein [bacterium]MDZ4231293.1 hypothetical protein [Patescibacteria group bacterium]